MTKKIGISIKLDVTKIDKARLFRGNKGTYLDATVFVNIDEADQYGNHGMITQDVTKAEKDSGVKGAILGNVKVFFKDGVSRSETGNSQSAPQGKSQAPANFDNFDDDLPPF